MKITAPNIPESEWVRHGHVIRDTGGKELASFLGTGSTFDQDIARCTLASAAKKMADALAFAWKYDLMQRTKGKPALPDQLHGAICSALTAAGYTIEEEGR